MTNKKISNVKHINKILYNMLIQELNDYNIDYIELRLLFDDVKECDTICVFYGIFKYKNIVYSVKYDKLKDIILINNNKSDSVLNKSFIELYNNILLRVKNIGDILYFKYNTL